jgi:hypothetical protein
MPQPIAALTLKFAQFRREGTLSCGSGKKTMCIALAILTLLADARQFWICTARYNFQDLTANNDGDCVSSDIGRPLRTETSYVRAEASNRRCRAGSGGRWRRAPPI